ncbi:hypothetical protein EBZ80_01980 [bacterium]|nr:hypothetical protein [bacterium]
MECTVCAEAYTSALRKRVSCPYCAYEFCVCCVKKYLLTQLTDPACMSCKVGWNREFTDLLLSKHFRNTDYKRHRENVLYEREKMLIPETVHKMDMNEQQKTACREKIRELLKERRELLEKIEQVNLALSTQRGYVMRLERQATDTIETLTLPDEKRPFIRPCPGENCRGFLNHKGTCPLCKTVVCMRCHELRGEEHECRAENIESVNQIRRETRACPKCGVSIFRIDGCRQMWCTMCHTAFDWKTGLVIEGRIHNPHYYEWTRRNGEAAEERPCDPDGLPALRRVREHLVSLGLDPYLLRMISEYHRGVVHTQHIDLARVRPVANDQDVFMRNIDARVNFLRSRITEDAFKNQLVSKENRFEKNRNMFLLLDMVVNTMISHFHELLTLRDAPSVESVFCQKTLALLRYANEQLAIHASRFSCRRYEFSNLFVLH